MVTIVVIIRDSAILNGQQLGHQRAIDVMTGATRAMLTPDDVKDIPNRLQLRSLRSFFIIIILSIIIFIYRGFDSYLERTLVK